MIRNYQSVVLGATVIGASTGLAAWVGHDSTQAALIAGAGGLVGVLLAVSGATAQDSAAVVEGLRRARRGERPEPPAGATAATSRIFDELARIVDDEESRSRGTKKAGDELDALLAKLHDGLVQQSSAAEETSRLTRQMVSMMREFASSVEWLSANASESSAAIVEMTSTSAAVATNLGELSTSVRETVSSMEEMAYSIKEVAKNVDALSLTAEETSSSMNEMDISIDQVQSNANETARLSEEVAVDAERGAEAILKTLGEINRIRESSQEAVMAIAALGTRIDAIGQIVNVIDDVAEQTNLLALNAAIIAAQAGEQGKGFAVVADEIKDLAERAGASTREITDLIKTVQGESRNAISAVERGAHNVDRGVQVSNDAEQALKKILESSRKSTNMVRAIARATVEQAKGSKQVTDAIGRLAETVQQIAAATAQQARGSELMMRSAEKMRHITQAAERTALEQARGGRHVAEAVAAISAKVAELNASYKSHADSTSHLLAAVSRAEDVARAHDGIARQMTSFTGTMRRP